MTSLRIEPAAKPLHGSVPVPTDKSIAQRAILLASIANGKSRLRNVRPCGDVTSAINAIRALGVVVNHEGKDLVVEGVGLFGLRAPRESIDCGNSATLMRLLMGLLAGQEFASSLKGDTSLSHRSMKRVAEMLALRGGEIALTDDCAPVHIKGAPERELGALEFASPVASGQLKSAALFSGLYAHGTTTYTEPHISRDHTERMLQELEIPIRALGPHLVLDPSGWSGQLPAFDVEIPGDGSSAAFLLVAAQLVEGSHVTVRNVGTNPTRSGWMDALSAAGLLMDRDPRGVSMGEPFADLTMRRGVLHGLRVAGELGVRCIDEIPILSAAAACAEGESLFRDLGELRKKESDRIVAIQDVLSAFGAQVEVETDSLRIVGSPSLRAAQVDSKGDHRIAMMASVLALRASGTSIIENIDPIATSFPSFVACLRALGATISVES